MGVEVRMELLPSSHLYVGSRDQTPIARLVHTHELYPLSHHAILNNVLVCLLRQISHCVALTGLEFVMQTRLAWNSQRSICLWLPSAGIKGMDHHIWSNGVLLQTVLG